MTATLIEGNAKNWAHTTMIILTDHYESLLAQIQVDLVGQTLEQFEGPFEVATKWARQNLGRRLQNSTLDQARKFIRERLLSSQPRRWEEQVQDASPSIPATRPRTTTTWIQRQTTTSTSGTQNHHVGDQATSTRKQITITAQIHQGPTNSSHTGIITDLHGPPTLERASPPSRSSTDRDTQPIELAPHLTTDDQLLISTNTDEDGNNNCLTVPDEQIVADGEYVDTDITLRLCDNDQEAGQPGPSSRSDQKGPVLRNRRSPPPGPQSTTESATNLQKTNKRKNLKERAP